MFEKDMRIQWQGYTSIFPQMLREMWKESEFTDIALIGDDANDQKILAHKVVLASSSPVFRNLLAPDGVECAIDFAPLHVKGIQHCDLKSLLHLIYHGQVDIPKGNFDAFIRATDAVTLNGLLSFDETDLKKITIKRYGSSTESELDYRSEFHVTSQNIDGHYCENELASNAQMTKLEPMNCKIDGKEIYQAHYGANQVENLCTTENTLKEDLLPNSDANHDITDEKRQALKERILDMLNKEVVCQFCQKAFVFMCYPNIESEIELTCNMCSKDLKLRRIPTNINNKVICLKCTLSTRKEELSRHIDLCRLSTIKLDSEPDKYSNDKVNVPLSNALEADILTASRGDVNNQEPNYEELEGSRKNSVLYRHENFCYVKKSVNKQTISVVCSERRSSKSDTCQGSGKITGSSFELVHSHKPTCLPRDEYYFESLKFKSNLKNEAECKDGTLKSLFDNASLEFPEIAVHTTYKNMKRTLAKRRTSTHRQSISRIAMKN